MRLWVKLLVIFAGGAVGTGLRIAVLRLVGDEVIALAAVNFIGCLLIGIVSGLLGPHATLARVFLAVGGIGAFTSWSTLALQGVTQPGGIPIVIAETGAGVIFAGLGHLAGMKLRGNDG
ncbi:CrcB family protein [Tessaracoccus sp. HDW20]|uniref:FluC/FEX family fluoride channel n=1 Tax=Tessaracoccus coleopterorum TaxID=2714950 RepID=UPI0018D36576|nr:CrcB family protein [Tessaracoccus coleopterorum]NHB85440.1 CrcB family protein [Tessaracoccus coleopterorum]